MSSVHAGLLWHVPRAQHVSPLPARTPRPCTSRSCCAMRSSMCQTCIVQAWCWKRLGWATCQTPTAMAGCPGCSGRRSRGSRCDGHCNLFSMQSGGLCMQLAEQCAERLPARPAVPQVYLASQCSTGPLHPELYRRCWRMLKNRLCNNAKEWPVLNQALVAHHTGEGLTSLTAFANRPGRAELCTVCSYEKSAMLNVLGSQLADHADLSSLAQRECGPGAGRGERACHDAGVRCSENDALSCSSKHSTGRSHSWRDVSSCARGVPRVAPSSYSVRGVLYTRLSL